MKHWITLNIKYDILTEFCNHLQLQFTIIYIDEAPQQQDLLMVKELQC